VKFLTDVLVISVLIQLTISAGKLIAGFTIKLDLFGCMNCAKLRGW